MKLQFTSSRLALAAVGALAIAPGALAQTSNDDRDTIVVTGTATPAEYEKIGQTITVLSAELIEEQGYRYVPEAMRQVPGAAVSQAGAPGSLTQVRMRGAEANHTLVLLDGIDISSPAQGETDFSTLLATDLRRIEVLRGPQSGLYGSNALAGVVNIISRRELNGHYATASAEMGSFGTFDVEAGLGIGDGDTYGSISLAHVTSEGYDTSPDQSANGVPAVGVGGQPGDKEGNRNSTVNLRGGTKLSDMLRVNGVVRYMTGRAELDGQAYNYPISGRSYDDASRTEYESVLVGASATLDPYNGAWETIFSVSHLEDSRTNYLTNFPFLMGPPVPSPADLLAIPLEVSGTDSTRFKFGVQSTYTFGDDALRHFVTGFAEREEETYEETFTGREEERTLNAIGLQYRAEIAQQLYLYATARHDENDAFQDIDTWSLAASWAIPNTGTRLHASTGTGVTNPTFIEQFGFNPSTFVGNAALVPEEALGWDAGIEQTLFNGKLVVDATYFSSTLENEIFTAFLPGFFSQAQNRTTESDRSGWELTVYADPTDDISLYGTYTKLDATEPAGIEIRRPEHTASLDGSWRINGGPVKLNLGVSYTGKSYDTDFATFAREPVDAYTLVRLGASWQMDNKFEVYARAENLLDEKYQEIIGYNGAPQAFYIGVRFRDEVAK